MTKTNIKNLPEGNYFTEWGYSQSYPYLEVSRTAKTVTIVPVMVKKDPDFHPNILPGGFAGHCDNQHEQTWLFDYVDHNFPRTIRLTKKGWALKGVQYSEGVAREFYDWNF